MDEHSGASYHMSSGRLLACFRGNEALRVDRESLKRIASIPSTDLEVLLDWLVELELLVRDQPDRYHLGRGRRRVFRNRYALLLHVEPDPAISSLCQSLLAEDGYPVIGAEDSSAAHELLDSIEFDLALLCGLEQEVDVFRNTNGQLLRRLQDTPMIVYGTVPSESADLAPFAAVLPGPLEGATLLKAIHPLLQG